MKGNHPYKATAGLGCFRMLGETATCCKARYCDEISMAYRNTAAPVCSPPKILRNRHLPKDCTNLLTDWAFVKQHHAAQESKLGTSFRESKKSSSWENVANTLQLYTWIAWKEDRSQNLRISPMRLLILPSIVSRLFHQEGTWVQWSVFSLTLVASLIKSSQGSCISNSISISNNLNNLSWLMMTFSSFPSPQSMTFGFLFLPTQPWNSESGLLLQLRPWQGTLKPGLSAEYRWPSMLESKKCQQIYHHIPPMQSRLARHEMCQFVMTQCESLGIAIYFHAFHAFHARTDCMSIHKSSDQQGTCWDLRISINLCRGKILIYQTMDMSRSQMV